MSGNDHVTIITLDTADDPLAFVSGLVSQLFAQKLSRSAWGRTSIVLVWKGGKLDTIEIADSQTVKFSPKTLEEAKENLDVLRREHTGKAKRDEVP